MMTKTTATFRVIGDDLDPAEITQLMKVAPSSSSAKGDLRKVHKDREFRQPTGVWLLSTPDSDESDLDGQIELILNQLPQDLSLWSQLSSRYRLDFYCGAFFAGYQAGLELAPETLLALGKRGIKLGLDLYSNFGDHDWEESSS